MKRLLAFIYTIVFLFNSIAAQEIGKVSMKPPTGMTRADIVYIAPKAGFKPRGILLLASGFNSNAEFLIKKSEWREFADKNGLLLAGLSFASDVEDLTNGKGYYYADKHSGKVFLEAIAKIAPQKLPIFLYGFSGGAHFVSRFCEWSPERVGAFCAYSAAWWDYPRKLKNPPPAIIACGDSDLLRLKPSQDYFEWGRKLGRKWTWIKLAKTGHSHSATLDDFVRKYFENILKKGSNKPVCMELDSGRTMPEMFYKSSKILTSYYPNESLSKISPHSLK